MNTSYTVLSSTRQQFELQVSLPYKKNCTVVYKCMNQHLNHIPIHVIITTVHYSMLQCVHIAISDDTIKLQPKSQFLKQQGMLYVMLLVAFL